MLTSAGFFVISFNSPLLKEPRMIEIAADLAGVFKPQAAVQNAALSRFRPILMNTESRPSWSSCH